jgi:hypothetical protein
MGAAASVHDENEIITRARAEELAGPEFDEIAWEEAVGTSGTISGREWNRNLASFVDSVRPLTSPMKRAQRPGLNRRELELELWYFSVGALCNPEVFDQPCRIVSFFIHCLDSSLGFIFLVDSYTLHASAGESRTGHSASDSLAS